MGEVMPGRAGLELPSQTRFNCPTCKKPLKNNNSISYNRDYGRIIDET